MNLCLQVSLTHKGCLSMFRFSTLKLQALNSLQLIPGKGLETLNADMFNCFVEDLPDVLTLTHELDLWKVCYATLLYFLNVMVIIINQFQQCRYYVTPHFHLSYRDTGMISPTPSFQALLGIPLDNVTVCSFRIFTQFLPSYVYTRSPAASRKDRFHRSGGWRHTWDRLCLRIDWMGSCSCSPIQMLKYASRHASIYSLNSMRGKWSSFSVNRSTFQSERNKLVCRLW